MLNHLKRSLFSFNSKNTLSAITIRRLISNNILYNLKKKNLVFYIMQIYTMNPSSLHTNSSFVLFTLKFASVCLTKCSMNE